jgi:hypothetical protein
VRLAASHQGGGTSYQTVVLDYTSGQTWPTTYDIDWSTVDSPQDVADVVDGHWVIDQNTSTIRSEPGYDRLLTIGDVTWDSFEVEVPITIHDIETREGPQLYPSFVAVVMRWQGHYVWGDHQPNWGWWPLGAFPLYGWGSEALLINGNRSERLMKTDGSGEAALWSYPVLQTDVPYIFKTQVQSRPGDVSIYRLKVWRQGDPEPTAWDLEAYGQPYIDASSPGELKQGSVGLITYYTDVTFGNVSIRPLDPILNYATLESEVLSRARRSAAESPGAPGRQGWPALRNDPEALQRELNGGRLRTSPHEER